MANYTPLNESIIKLSEKSKKRNLLQVLMELDLLAHLIIFTLLITFITLFLVNEKMQKKFISLSQANQTVNKTINTTVRSSGVSNSSIYINQQVIYVNKKYFNLPDSFHLTINGPIKKHVFGYLPYWMVDSFDEIDLRVITSLSYFGLEIDGYGNINQSEQKEAFSPYEIWQNDERTRAVFDRAKRNKTKTFLTFKSFNNANIENLVSSPDASEKFIETVLYQVNSRGLDGVNIDFEYDGTPDEKIRNRFSVLMSALNDALKSQGSETKLLISVYASAASVNQLWDIPYLANHGDGIIIMGYDFFTPNSSSAGPVAPLTGYDNSVTGIINNFLEQIPAEKIILAVPYYGYDWITENSSETAVKKDTPVAILSYAEINETTKNKDIIWNENSQTPSFRYLDDEKNPHIIHFDNIKSLALKYDLINKKNLSGVGIWSLGFEGNDKQLMQLLIDKFANY